MRRRLRIAIYVLAGAAFLGALLVGPVAWATPGQSHDNQTVPTRTPKPPPQTPKPPEPTVPSGGTGPGDTPAPPVATAPPGATAAPGETPQPTATATIVPAAVTARLALEKTVDRDMAWPGVALRYTLVLQNTGTVSARQVVIEDPLPPALIPGEIIEGTGASWNQHTLQVQSAVLPPGGKVTVVFSAVVGPETTTAPTLVNAASASAAGGLVARASAAVALPPIELPPVGGSPTQAMRDLAAGR